MVSRVIIGAIAIAWISLASVFGESTQPPVRLNERHLRALSEDQLRFQHEQQQHQQQEQQQQQQQQGDEGDGRYGWEDSVPGLPGRDYPNLTSIPETSFSCAGKTAGGYYADVETRCQVFHVCSTQGLKSSFLCPSGSIFNQRHFVCDWWYDFICEQALELYSLNDALNDPNSSTDPPTLVSPNSSSDDVDRYNQLPLTPVQFNSIGAGSNTDLSLASSGYTNNLRDEANHIYEDYNNGKIAEKPAPTSSGIPDNYSDARRKESARSYEEPQQQQQQQQQQHRQPIYRRRPSQGPDNVPRGFSKSGNDENSREFKRGDQGPGFYVNNGLSDNFKDQNYQLAGENNNFIDNSNYYRSNSNENYDNYNRNTNNNNNYNNNNYNSKITNNENNNFNTRNIVNNNQNYNAQVTSSESTNFNARNVAIDNTNYNSKVTTSESSNFNARNVAFNNDNYNSQVTTSESSNFNTRNIVNNNANSNNVAFSDNNNNNNLNDYQNFYQNTIQYPLPQENNNYDNNFNNQNFVNTERQNENYYNSIRIYSSEYNNKYNNENSSSFNDNVNYNNNKQNYDTNNYNNDNNYANNQNVNTNVNFNEENNNKNRNIDNNYKNKFESDYTKPIHVESTTVDYNFQDDQYETTINPDFLINASPSEEEVDRETQREVDSVDLKRQRPPFYTRQYSDTYTSPPGFLIREETSWRDDLSTSSSGSQSPPFPPERNFVGSESTPTLPRPEETTTPVTISTRRQKESPKFLGRRPAGGLPSGTGNGLPGANKNLAGSNAITGKPNEESSTNSISSVDDVGNGYSTYRPPQGFTASPHAQESFNNDAYRAEGQYWNNGRESWNDGAKYNNNQRY